MRLNSLKLSAIAVISTFLFVGQVTAQEEADSAETTMADASDAASSYISGMSSPSGSKRLSVGVNLGLKSDMAALGATITKDGTIDVGETTVANSFYGTNQWFMSDRDNKLQKYNSDNTASPLNTISDYKEGGAMTGLDIGVDARYDLDDILGLPLFARGGFNYVMKIGGGTQERTLGNTLTNSSDGQALLAANSMSDVFSGGVMKSTWNASWMYIPVSVGLNARISEKSLVYFGAGVSWFNGGWSVDMDLDQKYVNALTTYYDSSTNTLSTLSGAGPVSQTVEFKASGLGVNYFLGVETFIADSIAVFGEMNASGYAATSFSNKASSTTSKVFTRATSKGASDQDTEFIKRLSYPVVMGGATIKIGTRYYIM